MRWELMTRIHFWWYSMIVSLVLFICMTSAIYFDLLVSFDQTIIYFIQGFETPILTTIFTSFTHFGSIIGTLIVFFILLFIFLKLKWRAESIILTAVTLSTPFINSLLKSILQRPRPDLNLLIEIGGYSFPSGHTMYAVSLYGITLVLLLFKFKKLSERILFTILIIFMITMITVSRVYLGVHYPSDIIGGIFVSVWIISITFYLYLRIRDKEK